MSKTKIEENFYAILVQICCNTLSTTIDFVFQVSGTYLLKLLLLCNMQKKVSEDSGLLTPSKLAAFHVILRR